MGSWPTILVNAASTKDDFNSYIDFTIDNNIRKDDCTLKEKTQLKIQLKDRSEGK